MTTIDEIKRKHNQMYNESRKLLIERGEEYAQKDDELKTFISVGESLNQKPSQVALLLLSIKYHRITEQISKNKIPRDSFRDLINYCTLTELLLEQEEEHEIR